MDKKYFILLFILIPVSFLFSQSVGLEWSSFFGGELDDVAEYVVKVNNGYLILGNTYSFGNGNSDIYLIRINSFGDSIWTKSIGWAGNESAQCMVKTNDGNFAITGYTDSYGNGKFDVFLVKIDTMGEIIWSKTFGGDSSDYGMYIKETNDKGFIIVGYTRSFLSQDFDVYVIKTDSAGELEWEKNINIGGNDKAYGIEIVSEGEYIISGYTDLGIFLFKINNIGNIVWMKIIQDSTFSLRGYSVCKTSDKGFILAGKRQGMYILKTDSSGEYMWDWEHTSIQGVTDGVLSFQTIDEKYIVLGNNFYFGNSNSSFLILLFKTDSNGVIWQYNLGSLVSWRISKWGIQTEDGGYLIVGGASYFNSPTGWDVFVAKLTPDMDIRESEDSKFSLVDAGSFSNNHNISLFDVSGKRLLRTNNICRLPKGIYFIIVREKEKIKKRKLLNLR